MVQIHRGPAAVIGDESRRAQTTHSSALLAPTTEAWGLGKVRPVGRPKSQKTCLKHRICKFQTDDGRPTDLWVRGVVLEVGTMSRSAHLIASLLLSREFSPWDLHYGL